MSRNATVVEDEFYNKLERLSVQVGKKDKILAVHVPRICEAHDTVMRSYYQQIHGSSRVDAMTLMENIGEQVYVYITHLFLSSAAEERDWVWWTGRGGISMAWGREGQGARKGNGVRAHRLPSPPCFV